MLRRDFLKATAVAPVLAQLLWREAMAGRISPEEHRERAAKFDAEALAVFPFERVQVSGKTALQEWERLKRGEQRAPIVIGGDRELKALAAQFHPGNWTILPEPNLAETLARADELTHPQSLLAHWRKEEEQVKQFLAADPGRRGVVDAFIERLKEIGFRTDRTAGPPIGRWPIRPPAPTELSVVWNRETDSPFDVVNIVLVPTDDWTEIPAYMRWGNWNQNPPAEYHVAALRSWRDRYGAELVGLSFDVINIRVADKPETREEAMALAREQYGYCNDIVDQGVGTLSELAASLKAHDWWYFWWD